MIKMSNVQEGINLAAVLNEFLEFAGNTKKLETVSKEFADAQEVIAQKDGIIAKLDLAEKTEAALVARKVEAEIAEASAKVALDEIEVAEKELAAAKAEFNIKLEAQNLREGDLNEKELAQKTKDISQSKKEAELDKREEKIAELEAATNAEIERKKAIIEQL